MRTGLVTLLAVGCSFHPSLAIDASMTGDDDDAPSGSDAAVFSAPTCGTPGSLQTSFASAPLDPHWLVFEQNATYAIANNTFTVTETGTDMMSGLWLYAAPFVNMTDGEFRFEVKAPLPSPGVTDLVLAGSDRTHYISMRVAGGALDAAVADGGPAATGSAAYNMGSAYWWSVLDNAGELYVRISPDETTWTDVLAPRPAPSFIAAARPVLQVGGAAGLASFAAIDTAQPSVPWCDATTLHDTFAAGDQQWLNSADPAGIPPQCMYTLGSGGTVKPTAMATCAFESTYAYNLVDSSFVIAWGAGSADARFVPLVYVSNGTSYAEVFVDGSNATTYGWAPQSHAHVWDPAGSDAYWRVSESGGMLTFENSATGADGSWSTLATGADPFDLSGVELGLGAGATMMPMAGQQVTFLGVN